ncbi:MAG: methionyl-tRNA formyltransferase [Clostridia bacterium]|nr:methionyl-tRNA formyltransferase [Clostridia bacterium]
MKSVVFMGTPDFAVPALEALINSPDYDVKLVISQTDKPQGRKQILTPPPVKQLALQYDVEVYQPDTLKTDEAYEKIASCSPDFIVVSAYGKILPKRILDIPVYGCVNLHGSLLPKYRGAAPIQWSVINGDEVTGVTTMLMDVGLDTGDILLTSEKTIDCNETAGEVFDALADLCPELLLETLEKLAAGAITPIKQNESEATYVSVLTKEMALIDWNKSADTIHNLVRGLNPWPVARTFYNNKILKIFKTTVCEKHISLPVGTVKTENNAIYVACGNNTVLSLDEIQLEGSKRMTAEDFLRGRSFEPGFSFVTEE